MDGDEDSLHIAESFLAEEVQPLIHRAVLKDTGQTKRHQETNEVYEGEGVRSVQNPNYGEVGRSQ